MTTETARAVDPAFMSFVDNQIGSIGDAAAAIEDFGNAIACGLALEVGKHEPVLGSALARLGYEITERAERIAAMHKAIGNEIFRRRHPDLAVAALDDDGNGEIEEAAGGVGGEHV